MSDSQTTDAPFEAAVYEAAFQNIAPPALITDTQYVIREMNEAGLEFTGYDREEILGQPVTIISGDENVLADVIDSVSEGETWTGEWAVPTKDGDTVYGKGSAGPIVVDGETRGFGAIFIDTTKQRQFENTSEVLNRLLRHDMRNNLNAVYGYVQQARSLVEDEDAAEYLDRANEMTSEIIRQSERARDLRELLERSYEAANQSVRLDFALNEALVEVINGFEEANFKFDAFPEVYVVADDLLPTAIETVLENAVVHNDAETPVVEVAIVEREDDVILTVTDNGPGIPEGQEDLIFGREEVDQLHHGSGLSLFFADNVIESYHGDIWVENDPVGGAVFNVRLNKP